MLRLQAGAPADRRTPLGWLERNAHDAAEIRWFLPDTGF
jgi:hypothetical protein